MEKEICKWSIIAYERQENEDISDLYETETEAQDDADRLTKESKGNIIYKIQDVYGTKKDFGGE